MRISGRKLCPEHCLSYLTIVGVVHFCPFVKKSRFFVAAATAEYVSRTMTPSPLIFYTVSLLFFSSLPHSGPMV